MPSYDWYPPCQSRLMISRASRKRSWRFRTLGKSPTMCSFSRSPAPTPRVKRLSERICTVAAACAMIAGWYRKDGQVTPVASPIREVAAAIVPSIDQVKPEWPWVSSQG